MQYRIWYNLFCVCLNIQISREELTRFLLWRCEALKAKNRPHIRIQPKLTFVDFVMVKSFVCHQFLVAILLFYLVAINDSPYFHLFQFIECVCFIFVVVFVSVSWNVANYLSLSFSFGCSFNCLVDSAIYCRMHNYNIMRAIFRFSSSSNRNYYMQHINS